MAQLLRVVDRRLAARASAPAFGLVDAAVVRPGLPVLVVAISGVGALVESQTPIRPGARTELTLDAPDGRRWPVGVEVLRCWVSAIGPMRYRAALRFERRWRQGSG